MQARSWLRAARYAWPVVALVVPLGILVALTGSVGSVVYDRTVTEGLIKIVAVVGLYIFVGNSGILSLGHVAFMGIAAYASTWQTCCPRLKPITMSGLPDALVGTSVPVLPASIISGLLAAVVAFLIGLVLMRLTRIAVAIATMATLFIFNVIYSNWDSVTQGTGSLVGLPMYVTPVVAFGWATIAIVAAYVYQRSRFGLALRTTRDDEVAASSIGISVYWQRIIAFTVSAFFLGIAGVLHGHYLGTIKVATFFLDLTFITLAMLVVGGRNSLAGAVVGVVVVSTVVELMRRVEAGVTIGGTVYDAPPGVEGVVLGLIMVTILVFRPNGLMVGREIPWPFGARTGSSGEGPATRSAPREDARR